MNTDNDTEAEDNTSVSDLPRNRGWLSLRQFATLMEKTYHTVLRWKRERRFNYIKVGGEHRVTEEEVRYILENGTRPPGTGTALGE